MGFNWINAINSWPAKWPSLSVFLPCSFLGALCFHSVVVFFFFLTYQLEEISAASSSATSITERPPYSYMAMIQFAINSTEKRRMTLKDIYTWIEDHFPYFKHIAKPGWKVTHPWAYVRGACNGEKVCYGRGYWFSPTNVGRAVYVCSALKPLLCRAKKNGVLQPGCTMGKCT